MIEQILKTLMIVVAIITVILLIVACLIQLWPFITTLASLNPPAFALSTVVMAAITLAVIASPAK